MSASESIEVTSDLPPYARIPRWLARAPVSDRAYRLFGVLTEYAHLPDGARPGWSRLAEDLGVKQTLTVKRAADELVQVGALTIEQRRTESGQWLTNRYHLHYRPHGWAPVAHESRPDAPHVGSGKVSRVARVATERDAHVTPVRSDRVTAVGEGGSPQWGRVGHHSDPNGRENPWENPPTRGRAREATGADRPNGVGVGEDHPVVQGVIDRLTSKLPPDARSIARDRRRGELTRLVATLTIDRGWTAGELDAACADPPAGLLYPAAWMLTRLEPLLDRESTAQRSARLDAAAAEPLPHEVGDFTGPPPELELPPIVSLGRPKWTDPPDRGG